MKLRYEFEAVDMGNEIVLVPIGDDARNVHGVIKLNTAGLEIINLLKTDISDNMIVDTLAVKYENKKVELQRFVSDVLKTLRENGLIEE